VPGDRNWSNVPYTTSIGAVTEARSLTVVCDSMQCCRLSTNGVQLRSLMSSVLPSANSLPICAVAPIVNSLLARMNS
jgi:hypothetical protein